MQLVTEYPGLPDPSNLNPSKGHYLKTEDSTLGINPILSAIIVLSFIVLILLIGLIVRRSLKKDVKNRRM